MMKQIVCLIFAGLAMNALAQIELPKHDWNITLKVVDDNGQPVGSAKAQVFYLMTNEIAGLTDTNGFFNASHRDGSENLGLQSEKAGYYSFMTTYHMGRNYQFEKWNSTQVIVLKRIINPIPMYAKSVNLGMPIFDKPAGFDLTVGDWVMPYGKGIRTDIIFTAHREKRGANDTDYKLTVGFPNTGDGIQEFSAPIYYLDSQGSALRSAQAAPLNGYQTEWIQTKTRRPGKPTESNWDINRNYYFRVRTVLDQNGNVKSALYGKIYGDFMQFSYYLNPTPNDRNVEFNPKQSVN